MPCNKTFCLKQVNPNISDLYFGIPFQRDESRMECYLCGKEEEGDGRIDTIFSNRFIRTTSAS